MVLTIAIFITLTLVVIVMLLAPQMGHGRVRFDATADPPAAFGYKMAWLAIKTRDTAEVCAALGLEACRPCSWKSGIGSVYDDKLGETHVFVSPPIEGWTFVVGLSLPYPVGGNFIDKCTPLLQGLGAEFEDVQYFFTYPLIDFFAWSRIVDGRIVRSFAIGDEGVVWNRGKITPEERQIGLKLFELRGVRGRSGDAGGELVLHPTEEHVLRLARAWSLDPTGLDRRSRDTGVGVIALAPRLWRAERMRKAA